MKKILLSLATIAFVGAAVAGFTGAFYKDVETSKGNTFAAGGLELLVDSESHYNGMVCTDTDGDGLGDQWQAPVGTEPAEFPVEGSDCYGTWEETDLEDIHKFFYFTDLKPGDSGEDTISLHVYDNDAWGRFIISDVVDRDDTCTGPEKKAEVENGTVCVELDGDGEIDNYLAFTGWLDQGRIPGFQNVDEDGNVIDADDNVGNGIQLVDPMEGNNIYDEIETGVFESPLIWDNELIGNLGPFDLKDVFSAAYSAYCTAYDLNGDNDYGYCHGFAQDGRMVKSTTYYFGLAWDFPLSTDNDAQTDEYIADMTFEVEQHRNNPTPFPPVDPV
ncbi:MAG: hypothetical protein KAS07_03845 [Candidatus Pacebacteria bacterium]|nr:hypothetical protein [Candidatus Paceibacterota bacterium]